MPATETSSLEAITSSAQVKELTKQIVEAMATHIAQTPDYLLWTEIKARRENPVFNYVYKMVRSGQPLQKFVDQVTAQNPQLREQFENVQQARTLAGLRGSGNTNGGSASAQRGN